MQFHIVSAFVGLCGIPPPSRSTHRILRCIDFSTTITEPSRRATGLSMHAVSNVYFGLNPMWVATCLLAITYAVIISEKVNRSIVALVGAALMVVGGVLTQEEA